jgi:Calcineurin-like phosphoesterase
MWKEQEKRAVKLWAISDLHLDIQQNRAGLRALGAYPEDWLIVAGDLCESLDLFAEALVWLSQRFARVFWVPGNHDLWLTDSVDEPSSSMKKYAALVEIARRLGVVTPEDPYVAWPPTGYVIVPLCTLYDYSFRPADVELADVVAWAAEKHNVGADEKRINLAPLSGMGEWCAMRCAQTEARLARELPADAQTILVGHYPLREDLVLIPRIPRFTPWCGTRRTENWHVIYRAVVAVSGHLHVRRTDWRDGTRFEEVSLGYPKQWSRTKGIGAYLREILPGQRRIRRWRFVRLS